MRQLLFSLFALALAFCAAGCAGGGALSEDPFPGPADYEVHGIDVSKYQGDIDWNSVRSSGVQFAWIKATEGGDRVDDKFAQNWASAKGGGHPARGLSFRLLVPGPGRAGGVVHPQCSK